MTDPNREPTHAERFAAALQRIVAGAPTAAEAEKALRQAHRKRKKPKP